MKKLLFIAAMAVLLLTACGKDNDEPDNGFEQSSDNVAYGTHSLQKMDILLPSSAAAGSHVPAVLLIHGGAWSSGDKSDFAGMKQGINNLGYAYVSVNYRMLGNGATYTDMLDDIANAVSHLKKYSAKYRIKTDKLSVWGSSAGGHLALLYSYSRQSEIPVAMVVSQVGPTDFCDPDLYATVTIPMLDLVNRLTGTQVSLTQLQNPAFTPPTQWSLASPIYHVGAASPPTIMAYGVLDDLVAYSNAVRLDAELTAKGVQHHFVSFPNSGHDLANDPDAGEFFYQVALFYLASYLPVAGL